MPDTQGAVYTDSWRCPCRALCGAALIPARHALQAWHRLHGLMMMPAQGAPRHRPPHRRQCPRQAGTAPT
eukprot:14194674-Alexandrium_andersonii.AAC.1